MPPPIINNPRCRGARCGGNVPGPSHGHLGPGGPFGRHFGRRTNAFGWPGGVGNRPGVPVTPPPIVGTAPSPVRPPGVPVTPPPIVGSEPPAYHPPTPTVPSYPPLGYSPPQAPGGYVRDRRTDPPPAYPPSWPYPPESYPPEYPIDPNGMASAGYGDPRWSYADDGTLPLDPTQLESGSPAWDLWQGLMSGYLDTRNAAASENGEPFPVTTVGDVRKSSLALSRELCLPRYDFADLAATRAAWRDALARIQGVGAGLSWVAPYPENERFWLSDALALAQRLAAVDARRNGIELDERGSLTLIGDHSDPLDLWQDLRQFFLARRMVRRGSKAVRGGEGFRYPETNVRDVAQVTGTLRAAATQTLPVLKANPELRAYYDKLVRAWWDLLDRTAKLSKGRALDEVYPDNEAFWLRDTKRLAIQLSTFRSLAPAGAYRFASPDGAS